MPRLCGGGFVDLTFQRRQNIYRNGPNTFQERKYPIRFLRSKFSIVWKTIMKMSIVCRTSGNLWYLINVYCSIKWLLLFCKVSFERTKRLLENLEFLKWIIYWKYLAFRHNLKHFTKSHVYIFPNCGQGQYTLAKILSFIDILSEKRISRLHKSAFKEFLYSSDSTLGITFQWIVDLVLFGRYWF